MDLVVYGNTTTSFTLQRVCGLPRERNWRLYKAECAGLSYGVAPPTPILVDLNRDNKPDILEPAKQPDGSGLATMVALNQTTGSFPSCAYPSRGSAIGVCSPAGTVTSPVCFNAAANSFGQIRKIELWVDGTKIGEQYHAWGQRARFDLTTSFSAGTHNATMFESDFDNRLQKLSCPFTVGTAGRCSAPTSPGVHVCQPANNGTTTSPVTVQAASTITGSLARMEVWVDGVKKFTETASTSFTTSVALGGGSIASMSTQ